MAGIPRFAQAAINSSGIDAPSRKLKAEREWSSMYISCQLSALSEPLYELRTESTPGETLIQCRQKA